MQGILDVFTDDGVFIGNERPSAVGKEQLKALFEPVFSQIRFQREFHFDEIIQQGDFGFARSTSTGTLSILSEDAAIPEEAREMMHGMHLGEFMGIPPTGKTVEVRNISLDQVSDGKFVEHFGASDWLQTLITLDVVSIPATVTGTTAP